MQRIPRTLRKEIVEYGSHRTKEEDQDCMIAMLGPRGNGKSTAAQQIQFEYDPTFNLDRIGWEYDEHRQKLLNELPLGSGYHADEIRFHSMDFRTSIGVEMDKFLTELRPFNQFTTWTSVRIHKLLGTFLEFAHFLFYFYGLGECVVLRRNDNILKGNAFGITKDIDKITDYKTFQKYFIVPAKRSKLFVGKFRFPQFTRDFSPSFYNEYKELRLQSTRSRFAGEVEVAKLSPELRRKYIERARKANIKIGQLSFMFEKSEATISKDISIIKQSGKL